MMRWFGRLFRLLVVAGGLTYVVFQINWHDGVELPAGYKHQGQTLTDRRRTVPVIERTPQGFVLALDEETRVNLASDRMGVDGGLPQFHPGITTVLATADRRLLLAALLLIAPMHLFHAVRWGLLLWCRDLPMPLAKVFRLHMVGQFFNMAMPGMVGGDVIKAYYAARRSDGKTASVISVFVDRAVGLFSLILVSATAGLFAAETAYVTLRIWWLIGLVIAGTLFYSSPRARRLGWVRMMIAVLPAKTLLRKLDQAVSAYRHHKRALSASFGMSLLIHAVIIGSAIVTGRALSITTPAVTLLATIPLIFLAGALPISVMGFGVMEPAGIALLSQPGMASVDQIVAMLTLVRIYQVFYALLGAWFFASRLNACESSRE